MQDLPVLIGIAGFIVTGVGAIAKHAFVTAQFGIFELTPAGRNEVRAVYGGFGVFMGFALLVALRQSELRDGILFAIVGARVTAIDAASRKAVLARYPRTGFAGQMSVATQEQAERAPHTRTRLLWRVGFERAIRRSAWRE